MNVKRISIVMMLFMSILIIQGCSPKETPQEKIYTILEKVVSFEDVFEKQQEPLVNLEEKEKGLYDKIISLGMKQYDQIVNLSNEALKLVDEREERINKEKKSIETSREHFKTVLPSINNIKDASLKKEAENLYTLMNDRYEAYDELYKDYSEAITYDKELYHMFQNKNLSLDELEGQINKINSTYEKVMKANDEFNQYTEKYNKAKLAFYKHAGLDVELKDDGTKQ